MTLKRALYAMTTLWIAAGAHASDLPRAVDRLGVEDGLPVDSVSAVTVDRHGFMWIATHGGIARYDGEQLRIFDAAGSPDIAGNAFASLYLDPGGNAYASGSGHSLLALAPDGVRRVHTTSNKPLNDARFIQGDPLCVTHATAISCADAEGRFSERLAFSPDEDVVAALAGQGAETWVVSRSHGISLRQGARQFTVLRDVAVRLVRGQAAVDERGDLWAVLPAGVVRVRRNGELTMHRLPRGTGADIFHLRPGADGTIWLGTNVGVFVLDEGGIVELRSAGTSTPPRPGLGWQDPQGHRWHSEAERLYRDGRLVMEADGPIGEIHFAPGGAVWVCTLRDGLYVLLPPRVKLYDRARGLKGENVYGLDIASDGAIWLGSLGAGVQRIARDGRVDVYGRDDGLPGPNAWAVAAAPDGSIYVASYRPGLFRKRPGTSRFVPVPRPPQLAGARIHSISFDAGGRLWLGTERGAWRQDPAGWTQAWPGAGRGSVKAVLHAADGTTWIGSDRGLWHLRDARATAVASGSLAETTIRGLYQDDRGDLWVSTEGRGLVHVSGGPASVPRVVRFGRAEGLPTDSPHGVVQDANGDYWINSNQGILHLTRAAFMDYSDGKTARLAASRVGIADGVATLEGNGGVQPSLAVDAEGRILFPTQRGLVIVDPAALPRPSPPRPYIEAISTPDDIALLDGSAATRSIEVRYGAVDLRPGANVRFRHRLLPLQREWTEAGQQRTATFQALPAGRHTFELQAGNDSGAWSEVAVRREVVLPARWYESRYRELVLVLLAAALATAFGRHRARTTHKRARVLESTVLSRTIALAREKARVEQALAELARSHRQAEESNRRLAEQAERLEAMDRSRSKLLANVSHELRTPLMLVDLTLLDLAELTQQPRQRTTIIQARDQTRHLNTLVEQLICLAQAEAGKIRLRYSRVDLCRLVRERARTLQPMASHRGNVRVEVACGPAAIVAFVDAAQITTILDNLIGNACRYAPAGSSVDVEAALVCDGDRARISVTDAGPGFPPEQAGRLFERFYRGDESPRGGRDGLGVGLALARELVELHGGAIGARSTPGAGATFWFELPLGADHISLADIAWGDEAPGPRPPDPIVLPAAVAARPCTPAVAIVEDHPDLGAYLAERLSAHLQVVMFTTLAEARERVLASSVSLALVDVVLPDGSGIDLCRELNNVSAAQPVPVLMMSARATHDDILAATQAGSAGFLAKPFTLDDLVAAITKSAPSLGTCFDARARRPDLVDPILAAGTDGMRDSAFGVSAWAARVHLSERQLRRRLVELTGLPPQAWLREQRLREVRRLMHEGVCRTLAEAGTRSGLDNPNYLYRLYKERFGTGPATG